MSTQIPTPEKRGITNLAKITVEEREEIHRRHLLKRTNDADKNTPTVTVYARPLSPTVIESQLDWALLEKLAKQSGWRIERGWLVPSWYDASRLVSAPPF